MEKFKQIKYDIGGRKLNGKHHMNGTPTVIFEAGLGDSSNSWAFIQNEIALYTSTFSYDRAGIGGSDDALKPRNCLEIVYDLANLLNNASIKAPYILVGHSFGGLVMRLFASIFTDGVAGIILVDAAPEHKELAYEMVLPEDMKISNREYLENPRRNIEQIDKVKSYKQIDAYKCVFHFPLTIIIRGLPDNFNESWPNIEILEIEKQLQIRRKSLSTNSKIRIAKQSGHYIHHDEPELVIKAIKQMIDK